jgi:hypothetical protein
MLFQGAAVMPRIFETVPHPGSAARHIVVVSRTPKHILRVRVVIRKLYFLIMIRGMVSIFLRGYTSLDTNFAQLRCG